MTPLVFGPEFSRAMCIGCRSIGAEIEWVCATLCLEGGGMNPNAANPSGARGMWQRMPEQLFAQGRPLVLPIGAPAPPGCILRDAKDPKDRTLIVGRSVWRLYGTKDPVQQLQDYFAWTRDRLASLNAGPLKHRSALYCINLAPERLRDGKYGDETVLYSMRVEDGRACYPDAYKQNAASFGLIPTDALGRLQMKHLAVGLDAAVRRHQAKYDAEVTAAYAANAHGSNPPPAV